MKTYQEKAEAYVRQQLPELMELSFGCEVIVPDALQIEVDDFTDAQGFIVGKRIDPETFITIPQISCEHQWPQGIYSWVLVDYWEECKIIGHPIQLAHVLRLLVEDWRGEFLEVWDLEKDWNNQEERVFKWLCNEWHI